MTYREILQALVLAGTDDYLMEGAGHSLPVFGNENGVLVDKYFLYAKNRDGSECSAPSARLYVDSDHRRVAGYFTHAEKPFTSGGSPTVKLTKPAGSEDMVGLGKRYAELYEQVRGFVFSRNPSAQELALAMRFVKTLFAFIEPELKPFYVELSPEFFGWIQKNIKKD